jgi:hypothetical protein
MFVVLLVVLAMLVYLAMQGEAEEVFLSIQLMFLMDFDTLRSFV